MEREFFVGVITLRDGAEVTIADSDRQAFIDSLEIAIEAQMPHVDSVNVYDVKGPNEPIKWEISVRVYPE